MVLLLLLLLPLVAADVLKDQLEHLVDYSVDPCDDFYYHVCKNRTSDDQFIASKMNAVFKNISLMFFANTPKNNILLDIAKLTENHGSVNSNLINPYEDLAREKCGNDLNCYRDDRVYYIKKFIKFTEGVEISLTDENHEEPESDSNSAAIDAIISETSEIFSQVVTEFLWFQQNSNWKHPFVNDVMTYAQIVNRIQMIEFVEANCAEGDIHDIKEFTKRMKEKMVEKINRSRWLHEDIIIEGALKAIIDRVASIGLYHDFNNIDRNLTMLRGLERDFSAIYNRDDYRKTGLEELDLCFRLMDTVDMLKKDFTADMKAYLAMMHSDYMLNSYYENMDNSITILAPFLHRKTTSSELVNEIKPLLTGAVIAHELFHSLFSGGTPSLKHIYAERSTCIMNHYNKTCETFGEGLCYSGSFTFNEDGADAEGWRLLYEMFREDHSSELGNQIGVKEATLEQAFFYFISMFWCKESQFVRPAIRPAVHSAGNIRVNAVVSLMPEFSEAFHCKSGDRLYTDRAKCQIFGEHS